MAIKELNVRGLTPEEAQQALDSARQYKGMSIAQLEDVHEKLIKKTALLVAQQDGEFASYMLEVIRENHLEILEKESDK